MKLTKEQVEEKVRLGTGPVGTELSNLCDDWLAMRKMLEEAREISSELTCIRPSCTCRECRLKVALGWDKDKCIYC